MKAWKHSDAYNKRILAVFIAKTKAKGWGGTAVFSNKFLINILMF